MGYNIAIDGPSGAGKSTIAKRVAKDLGFIYVDTGAMYRAMAVHFLKKGLKPEAPEKIVEACESASVTITYKNGAQQVCLNGEDVTALLRAEEVGNMASKSSVIPQVREKLLNLQRDLAKSRDVVMDGRDIGTNVLPDADVKIYLTASVRTRAMRRYNELRAKGIACDYDTVAKDIEERDTRDMTRETAPLKQAEDAVYLDTSDMTIDEVAEAIKKIVRK